MCHNILILDCLDNQKLSNYKKKKKKWMQIYYLKRLRRIIINKLHSNSALPLNH